MKRDRLNENQEVVGTDKAFFEDEQTREMLLNLYSERSGVLDEATQKNGETGHRLSVRWDYSEVKVEADP